MFGRTWEPASGVVIDKRMGKVKGSGESAFATMDFTVDVRTSSGDFFRAEVDQPRWSDFWPPKVGQAVKVEVEARSRKVRFLKGDSAISFAAFQQQQSSGFDAQLAAPAGTPPAGRPSAPAAAPVVPAIAPEQLQAMIAAAMANGSAVRMDLPPEAVAALRSMGVPADGGSPAAPGPVA